MSTTTRCDQCDLAIALQSRRITLGNLGAPDAPMLARDFDFCGADCFWAWVRKWSAPTPKPDASHGEMGALRFCPRCGDKASLRPIAAGECLICDVCHHTQAKP